MSKRINIADISAINSEPHAAFGKEEQQVLRLDVSYLKGGINYFSGNSERRGFYVGCSPIRVSENTVSFMIGGKERGGKSLIEEAARFNRSRLEKLAKSETAALGRILKLVLECNPHIHLSPEGEEQARPYLEAATAEPTAPTPAVNGSQKKKELPYTINAIVQQCGGFGITGAFVYCGSSDFVWKCPEQDGECRGDASHETPEGLIHYTVGVQFKVNGKRGELWKVVISYEPCDTYRVWLWTNKADVPGKMGAVIESREDVYCDSLKECVEAMYDRAIKARNEGFIPVA